MTNPTNPMLGHARKLYAAFVEASQPCTEEQASDFGVEPATLVFIGTWTKYFENRTDLPAKSTREKAFRFLAESGCVEVIKRGQRDYPSVIAVLRVPTADDMDLAEDNDRVRGGSRLDSLTTSVGVMGNRVTSVEDRLARVEEYLAGLEGVPTGPDDGVLAR